MRALALFVLVAGLFFAGGCAGVVYSPAEIASNNRQSIDLDLRQLTDDWNYLWLMDRQYRLTKWHVR